MTDLLDRYLACWNAADADERARLVDELFTADARYVDPLADAHGTSALVATMVAARTQFPQFVFSPLGEVDTHHDIARFGWGLGPAGADPVIEGSDVVQLTDDGRIAAVLGFLDRVPA